MSPPLVRRLASYGCFHENIAPEGPCQSVGGRDRGCNGWMADRVKLGCGANDWALVFLGENVSHHSAISISVQMSIPHNATLISRAVTAMRFLRPRCRSWVAALSGNALVFI